MAPVEKHFEILSGLGAELDGAEIEKITLAGEKTTIIFNNGKATIGLRIRKNRIAGMQF